MATPSSHYQVANCAILPYKPGKPEAHRWSQSARAPGDTRAPNR